MPRHNFTEIPLLLGFVSVALMHADRDARAQDSPHHRHEHSVHAEDARAEHGAQEAHAEHGAPDAHHEQRASGAHDEHDRNGHAGADPDGPLPAPGPAQLAAAFPDLGDRDIHAAMHDDPFITLLRLERLEVRDADAGTLLFWDAKASAGRDLAKLWVRSDGARLSGTTEHADLELLYGRAFAPRFDWMAGVRQDFAPGSSQTWAAFGIQGLAPYWFEVEATAYLGEGGRTAARVEVEYELLLTNRLILQPLLEVEWHGQDDARRGIGSGVGTVEAALRLRYEMRREIAPYVGIVRERMVGQTARLTRAAGHSPRETQLVVGVRAWF